MFNKEPQLQLQKRPKTAWTLASKNIQNQKTDGGAFNNERTYAMYTNGYTRRAGYIVEPTDEYRSSPVQIFVTGDFYTEIDCWSNSEFCASKRYDNTLWAWGQNSHGQLGQNDTLGPKKFLVQIPGVWDNYSCSSYTMAAIDMNNNLFMWGYSGHGELGQGNTIPRSSPIQVPGKWKKVVMGSNHTVCVDMNNALWTWGQNSHGQLGLNDTNPRSSPTQVGSNTDWSTLIAASGNNTFITNKDKVLYSFGYNGHGVLGINDNIGMPRSSPCAVFMTGWTSLSTNGNRAGGVIRAEDGTSSCWTWGYNGHHGLGHMDNSDKYVPTLVLINRSSPIQLGQQLADNMFVNWHAVHTNDYYTSFVDEGGGMWISGYNYQGQWPSSDWAKHASPQMYNFTWSSPVFLGSGFAVNKKDPNKAMVRATNDCWTGLRSNKNYHEDSRNTN